ncbi:hypothetical protein [Aquimarina muelleri]|uniref:Glutathionylspermidine synthase pre-ATP-grasp-like domain-containing protein n=1 Tax=Aquimarina muelleri TaxID=279356 RepID=A0A918N2W6_9FLAO|nr:hypothetical protein [Aquimarina muelleri]MCX2762216.1 hypothetical protein [Aquimarina muelleri]GGX16558.1 hypothetical protein GCM10007384_17530 [Aquimarina muelleri]
MKETVVQKNKENTILSDKFDMFFNNRSENLEAIIDIKKHNLSGTLKNFIYPVSSWPVILENETSNKLSELSVILPELIYQIPELYFDNDISSIAHFYFNGNEELAQYAMMCHNKKIEVSCRLDLTLTDSGFKILEINAGSSIGGWQLDDFEGIVRESHDILKNTQNDFKFTSIQSTYLNFLIDKTLQYVKEIKNEINVFVIVGNNAEIDSQGEKDIFFDNLLKQKLTERGMSGSVHIGKASLLKMIRGDLYLNNKRIHSVLNMDYALKNITPELFRAHIMGSVYFPDHLGTPILGDKRNLAILRELALSGKFDSKNNELILNSIPWTVVINNDKVTFKEQEHNLLRLLKEQKDQFVIKIANGCMGDSVFIGKFLSATEWEKAIEVSIGKEAYIAQEFSDSIDFIAPNISNQWTQHKLIWGSFGFGNTYGGVITRMVDVEIDDGIINSARGAVLGMVYECID